MGSSLCVLRVVERLTHIFKNQTYWVPANRRLLRLKEYVVSIMIFRFYPNLSMLGRATFVVQVHETPLSGRLANNGGQLAVQSAQLQSAAHPV